MRKFREALFLCLCALCTVDSQPVTCTTEAQCSEGYFCETSVHICRECLRCEDLNREPSSTPSTCITSVADCGACFKGLVLDRLADVNGACVVSGAEESSGTPHYVWWLGSAVIIFLALMIGIIVYISMNPGIFENFKCGGNCQSGTVSANIRTETKPSAPEAPPPYTPRPQNGNQYSSVRTAESPCPTTQHNEQGDNNAEEEVSFIKHSHATPPPDPRETAGKQGARVYNLPSYAREELPHSPETPMVTEVHDNLDIHDEETMESTWSPTNVSEATTGVTGAAGSSVPAVTAARDDSFCELTPASQMCLQTNSNYSNRENNPSGDTSQGTFSGSQNSALYNYVNINVFQNANVHCQNKYS